MSGSPTTASGPSFTDWPGAAGDWSVSESATPASGVYGAGSSRTGAVPSVDGSRATTPGGRSAAGSPIAVVLAVGIAGSAWPAGPTLSTSTNSRTEAPLLDRFGGPTSFPPSLITWPTYGASGDGGAGSVIAARRPPRATETAPS